MNHLTEKPKVQSHFREFPILMVVMAAVVSLLLIGLDTWQIWALKSSSSDFYVNIANASGVVITLVVWLFTGRSIQKWANGQSVAKQALLESNTFDNPHLLSQQSNSNLIKANVDLLQEQLNCKQAIEHLEARFIESKLDCQMLHNKLEQQNKIGRALLSSNKELTQKVLQLEDEVLNLRQKESDIQAGQPLGAVITDSDQGIESIELKRVLVVDDNRVNHKVISQMFEHLSIASDSAENGLVGFALWQANHYDLVICDCDMPIMDGFELAQTIRNSELEKPQQRTPIIGWTANALDEVIKNCYGAGMDDVLLKPTDFNLLQQMLIKHLHQ